MAPNLALFANFIDIKRPSLIITAPRSHQRLTKATFNISGIAKDNVAVAAVYCQVNNNNWVTANTTNAFANWAARAPLVPGSDTIRVYAVDGSGNRSSTNSVTVTYSP